MKNDTISADFNYYPDNGHYSPIPGTVFAQYSSTGNYEACPNPCRKYHVSSELNGAEIVASIVLPVLALQRISHKVVRSRSRLATLNEGLQVGKFITIYMNGNVIPKNELIKELGSLLCAAKAAGKKIHPSLTLPKARAYSHQFIEAPIDAEMFIYGGYVCDPKE